MVKALHQEVNPVKAQTFKDSLYYSGELGTLVKVTATEIF